MYFFDANTKSKLIKINSVSDQSMVYTSNKAGLQANNNKTNSLKNPFSLIAALRIEEHAKRRAENIKLLAMGKKVVIEICPTAFISAKKMG